MAVIKFLDSQKIQFLSEYHTFGRRDQSVDTHLPYPFISKLHTLVEWTADQWTIRDVSTNGTWVNGDKIANNVRQVLAIGDVVELAAQSASAFKVVSLEAPQDILYNSNDPADYLLLEEDSFLAPDKHTPEVALFKCPERGKWFSEPIRPSAFPANDAEEEESDSDSSKDDHPYESGPYEHGETIELSGQPWTFFLVHEQDVTTNISVEPDSIDDVLFRIDLSQDEESTELTLCHPDHKESLGIRSHHYLVAYLLRHKSTQQSQESQATDTPAQNFGWVSCELIARELGIDEAHLNILIFRARNQVTKSLRGFSGCSRFIERRRGQVRSGVNNFSIYKEGVHEI